MAPPAARMSFLDRVRVALFLAIPLYARFWPFASVLKIVGHLCIIGTTVISSDYFSKGGLGLALFWDIFYGLIVSSFPTWAICLVRITWLGCNMKGWRWEVSYWTFVARNLVYLSTTALWTGNRSKLPREQSYYMNTTDAMTRTATQPEYAHAYPDFGPYVSTPVGAVVYFFLWSEGYRWYEALIMF
jgi:hypothetical protein